MSIVDLSGSEVTGITKLWEFDQYSLSEALEGFQTKLIWDRATIVNDEKQFYCDPLDPTHYNPFSTDSEGLHITARRRQPGENYTTQDYLSGILTTQDSIYNPAAQRNFRLSALLRMPEGVGVWPALWSLPQFQNWPKGISILPELDCLEYLGIQGEFCSNCHTRAGNGLDLVQNKFRHTVPNADLLDFNWFHMERVDGLTRFGFNDSWVKSFATPFDLSGSLHFLLNLAIGGWAEVESGAPDRSEYQLSCKTMLLQDVEPTWATGPNKDLIQRLSTINTLQKACVTEHLESWIDELKN